MYLAALTMQEKYTDTIALFLNKHKTMWDPPQAVWQDTHDDDERKSRL